MRRDVAFQGLQCGDCRASYPTGIVEQRCTRCNGLLDTVFDPEILKEIPREALAHVPSMWKFRDFLPIEQKDTILSAGEGNTPLRRLGSFKRDVWVKDETGNPTGTFKDRGASTAVTVLSNLGIKQVVLSSEGNAGCSFALYSQMAGLACQAFLPTDANPSKIELSRKLGATVGLVRGTIADAGRRAEASAKSEGSYNASTFVTPYRHDGKGTMALEISDQLGWKAPDWVVYPLGGGVGLVGMWKMFSLLEEIGWTKNRPRFVAVQPEGCAPVVKAYNSRKEDIEEWKGPQTIALGLRIPKPLAGKWILRSLRESDGLALTVNEDEIRVAMKESLKTGGLLLEPSSATTLASLSKLYDEKMIDRSDEVVLIGTGSGLKTLEQL